MWIMCSEINAEKDNARAPGIFEAHHRLDEAFDGTMVLLDEVVEILVLPDPDRRGPPQR